MTCSYVWHDLFPCDVSHELHMKRSFIRVTCDVTHSIIRVTWLVHVWHDSFSCDMSHELHTKHSFFRVICDTIRWFFRVTWLIHMCDMTHSHVTWVTNCIWCVHHIRDTWKRKLCETWLIDSTNMCVTWLTHLRDMTHSHTNETWKCKLCVWYDSVLTQFYAGHDTPIYVAWLTLTCDTVRSVSCVWQHSFIQVLVPTRMTHMNECCHTQLTLLTVSEVQDVGAVRSEWVWVTWWVWVKCKLCVTTLIHVAHTHSTYSSHLHSSSHPHSFNSFKSPTWMVTWPIHMWDTWLIHMCDMTRSHEWHDSFTWAK